MNLDDVKCRYCGEPARRWVSGEKDLCSDVDCLIEAIDEHRKARAA